MSDALKGNHSESHKSSRNGWLRAVVLGANDGTISVASLVVGVAAAGAPPATLMLTGVAGLVAGAMSMAAGEYVSVRTQADTEAADLEREKRELQMQPERELAELTAIYVARGLEPSLAMQVATQLMAYDALGAHARDELGLSEALRARPVQAALASAGAFALGAMVPLATVMMVPAARVSQVAFGTALITLMLLGGTAAWAGGASVLRGALRVAFWGAMAMGLTALISRLIGTSL